MSFFEKLKSYKLIFLIVILAALGQMTQTMYVPSINLMSIYFDTLPSNLAIVMAVYMIPYGFSQFIYGSLSDIYGRKNIILISLIIFLVGTALAVCTSDFDLFLLGTFIQGIGIGSSGAMVRTVPRDKYSGFELRKANSIASMGLVICPLLGPLLGSFLSTIFPWQSSYIFLLCMCVVVYILMQTSFDETLPIELRKKENIIRKYKDVLLNKEFSIFLFCILATFSGLAIYEAEAGILLGSTLHFKPAEVSILFIIPLPGFLIGSWLAGKCRTKKISYKLMLASSLCLVLGSLIILSAGVLYQVNTISIILGGFIYFLGAGVIFPLSVSFAIEPFKNKAGTAGALLGGVQNLGAGIFVLLGSEMSTQTEIDLGIVLLFCSFLSLLMLSMVYRTFRKYALSV